MPFLQDKIFKLKGKVQHYAWGGFEFIPHWLHQENSSHQPCAEYWMGAHPSASSTIFTRNGELNLQHLIKDYPTQFLGEKIAHEFGELPYLFKILDVKEMLSIQVHPSKTEAIKGFEAEEAAGVPMGSAHRNYKDKNHKPEVMVALSEFWLLHGFKQPEYLKAVLQYIPAFQPFLSLFEQQGYKGLYQHVMQLPQHEVNELLTPLVLQEIQHKLAGNLNKNQPGWWVAKLFEPNGFNGEDIDRGVFSIYFFNIVQVKPGEGVFQGAGVPHAYLEGQNIELMANSDNVLRGGLTPKHIDVPELLKHTSFEGITPQVLKGQKCVTGENKYACPVPDFGLTQIVLQAEQSFDTSSTSLEIIVVMEGEVLVEGYNTIHAKQGEAIAIVANEKYKVSTASSLLAYKAFVP